MKLLKTITRLVEEAESNYNLACDRGENPKVLEKLEKNYLDTLRLVKLYEKTNGKVN